MSISSLKLPKTVSKTGFEIAGVSEELFSGEKRLNV